MQFHGDPYPMRFLPIFSFSYPSKSIIICASVSKVWKSLIKSPTFISTYHHHSLNKNQNQNLLFIGLCSENQKEFYALHNLFTLSMLLTLIPITENTVWWVLVTSCFSFPMILTLASVFGTHVLESF